MGCWSELLFYWWNPKGKHVSDMKYSLQSPLAVIERRTSWCIKTVSPLSEHNTAGNEPQIKATSFFQGMKIVVFSPTLILENKILMKVCRLQEKKNLYLAFLNVHTPRQILKLMSERQLRLYTTYRGGLHQEIKI